MKKITVAFIAQWLLSTSLLFGCGLVYAQNEGRWYTIEVLIFKRAEANSLAREIWPSKVGIDYPSVYQYLVSGADRNFGLQPKASHQLGGFNYTLGRDEEYKVLFHRAWRQQVLGEQQSPGIIVNGGESIGGRQELEGHLKIHVARYLHLQSDLWLTQLPEADAEAIWPELPARPGVKASTPGRQIISNDGQSFLNGKSIYPFAIMKSKRRMRSNELHYVDHPLMGILAIVTPIEEQ